MQADAKTGTTTRSGNDVIPFRQRVGDVSARWGEAGGRAAEKPRRAFLGLTIETVSRTIAELARDGVVGRPGGSRRFALRNLTALRNLSG
jgi:hypothetical protein